MTPADESLLRLVRRSWDADAPRPALAGNAVDWTGVVETALNHGVAGLLCRSLRQLPQEDVPADIAGAAGVYLEDADAEGAWRIAHLFDVLDVLTSEAIPALAFKGPVLGVLAYSSATARPSRDIDILLHRADMARGVAALASLGYHPDERFPPRIMDGYYETYGQVTLHAIGRTPVDLHWMFAPKALAVELDMRGLWNRATPVEIAGRSVPSLSLEDTLIAACLHGSKEKWWRLLWVADVAALIKRQPDLDWSALCRRADEAGVHRMLLLGLALARDLFASDLPPKTRDAIEHDAQCLTLVQESRQRLFDATTPVGSVNDFSRYHYRARERFADRARYVWRMATTPGVNHFRMVTLPDSLFHGYVAIKLVHDYLLLPAWNVGKGRWWRNRNPNDERGR